MLLYSYHLKLSHISDTILVMLAILASSYKIAIYVNYKHLLNTLIKESSKVTALLEGFTAHKIAFSVT